VGGDHCPLPLPGSAGWLGKGNGGAKGESPFPYKKLPQSPTPNPIRVKDWSIGILPVHESGRHISLFCL